MSKKRYRTHSVGKHNSGSPFPGEPEFLAVGKLHRPHGLTGEIIMSVWTDFPERLTPGTKVFLGKDYKIVKIHSVRWHRNDILISFENYETREAVGVFRNQEVFVRADDRPPLKDGFYYLHQLLGLRVVEDSNKKLLGFLVEVLETGANNVFIIRPESGKDILLPDIDSVILNINFEEGEMIVHLIPGLVEEKKS
ncbi:MAG: 16S rRNA processing protein RimM [Anaerolineales bacterium]|nr:16S rRNA processing protein RimM [Anaerolineales bacterium]HEY62758.1 16S rRNA processing protein RimM [Anaerolineae bacterium]